MPQGFSFLLPDCDLELHSPAAGSKVTGEVKGNVGVQSLSQMGPPHWGGTSQVIQLISKRQKIAHQDVSSRGQGGFRPDPTTALQASETQAAPREGKPHGLVMSYTSSLCSLW